MMTHAMNFVVVEVPTVGSDTKFNLIGQLLSLNNIAYMYCMWDIKHAADENGLQPYFY